MRLFLDAYFFSGQARSMCRRFALLNNLSVYLRTKDLGSLLFLAKVRFDNLKMADNRSLLINSGRKKKDGNRRHRTILGR